MYQYSTYSSVYDKWVNNTKIKIITIFALFALITGPPFEPSKTKKEVYLKKNTFTFFDLR